MIRYIAVITNEIKEIPWWSYKYILLLNIIVVYPMVSHLFFATPLFFIIAGINIYYFFRKKRTISLFKRIVSFLVLMMIHFLCFFTVMNVWFHFHSLQIEKSFKDGNRIVAAIEQYHSDHAHYPKTLDKLVPKYLESIPKTSIPGANNEFYYYYGKNYKNEETWHIMFFAGSFEKYLWYSWEGKWVRSD